VSKTNVYTLMATALLGVLLYVVLQFSRKVPTAPITTDIMADPAGLSIDGPADLLTILAARGIDAPQAIAESVDWRRARGFPGHDRMFGVADQNAPARTYESLDNPTLVSLSRGGDLVATQILATQILLDDPFASLALYTTAANQGSVFAMLRIGALTETFSNAALDKFNADPAYLRKLGELRGDGSRGTLKMQAFAYVAAAIRNGGVAIVDQDLLDWIQTMARDLAPAELTTACELSENIFLKFSVARRRLGLAQIRTEVPPVFFGVPNLQAQLPCQSTGHSIIWLLDLSRCSAMPVVHSDEQARDLYICQS
jgi:hypothetical protein